MSKKPCYMLGVRGTCIHNEARRTQGARVHSLPVSYLHTQTSYITRGMSTQSTRLLSTYTDFLHTKGHEYTVYPSPIYIHRLPTYYKCENKGYLVATSPQGHNRHCVFHHAHNTLHDNNSFVHFVQHHTLITADQHTCSTWRVLHGMIPNMFPL